ncbi:FAD-binding oxidoreductase [Hymenobacter sp. BT683]|uniref:FAD-binding oxidoreductase n=1 Tax=Hymenobacter jeongseonensis TaxID=2791027 RepID=A0ABS0IPS2_9BACT|nr:FAD-binding oxidoreductase [Hymenobacter jeongseonensis]MBF9239918.1 FAD-binding oxidoreductase [Hymenobacter jeongseonensis]
MIAEETISQLATDLRGRLVEPHHAEYDACRRVHNGMIDKRPAAIAYCADVADVMACVNYAREHHLLVAVRGGGHSAAGMGLCDEGLVIDLSQLNGVHVDPDTKTVRVEGGCTLGQLDHVTHAFGVMVPSGIISTTGVGGITLGGGLGHFTRQCGLSIDNLLEADVVLADGQLVKASAEENADLFWALRGGGGNFGIVTSFLFRSHPISTVQAGPMLWELRDAPAVMRWYRDFIKTAPDELGGFAAFLTVPPGPPFPEHLHLKKMFGVVWNYTGAPDKAEVEFTHIRKAYPPALDLVGPLPVPALQGMFDALVPPGYQYYWKADFVNELSDQAIDIHLHFAELLPTPLCTMHLYPINGAAARVAPDATAWAYRNTTWSMVILGVDPDPANNGKFTSWAKEYWQALHSYGAGGAYVNFMMDEGTDRVKATYGDNYPRLVEIKSKYDPHNLFHVNQNIVPHSDGVPLG